MKNSFLEKIFFEYIVFVRMFIKELGIGVFFFLVRLGRLVSIINRVIDVIIRFIYSRGG